MPLAYVHFVQVLVDSLVALAPFALYPRLGALAVVLAGILTLFYRGFLGLSKSFLDPFGNDDSVGQNLQVETLLGETNKACTRWSTISKLPFPLLPSPPPPSPPLLSPPLPSPSLPSLSPAPPGAVDMLPPIVL